MIELKVGTNYEEISRLVDEITKLERVVGNFDPSVVGEKLSSTMKGCLTVVDNVTDALKKITPDDNEVSAYTELSNAVMRLAKGFQEVAETGKGFAEFQKSLKPIEVSKEIDIKVGVELDEKGVAEAGKTVVDELGAVEATVEVKVDKKSIDSAEDLLRKTIARVYSFDEEYAYEGFERAYKQRKPFEVTTSKEIEELRKVGKQEELDAALLGTNRNFEKYTAEMQDASHVDDVISRIKSRLELGQTATEELIEYNAELDELEKSNSNYIKRLEVSEDAIQKHYSRISNAKRVDTPDSLEAFGKEEADNGIALFSKYSDDYDELIAKIRSTRDETLNGVRDGGTAEINATLKEFESLEDWYNDFKGYISEDSDAISNPFVSGILSNLDEEFRTANEKKNELEEQLRSGIVGDDRVISEMLTSVGKDYERIRVEREKYADELLEEKNGLSELEGGAANAAQGKIELLEKRLSALDELAKEVAGEEGVEAMNARLDAKLAEQRKIVDGIDADTLKLARALDASVMKEGEAMAEKGTGLIGGRAHDAIDMLNTAKARLASGFTIDNDTINSIRSSFDSLYSLFDQKRFEENVLGKIKGVEEDVKTQAKESANAMKQSIVDMGEGVSGATIQADFVSSLPKGIKEMAEKMNSSMATVQQTMSDPFGDVKSVYEYKEAQEQVRQTSGKVAEAAKNQSSLVTDEMRKQKEEIDKLRESYKRYQEEFKISAAYTGTSKEELSSRLAEERKRNEGLTDKRDIEESKRIIAQLEKDVVAVQGRSASVVAQDLERVQSQIDAALGRYRELADTQKALTEVQNNAEVSTKMLANAQKIYAEASERVSGIEAQRLASMGMSSSKLDSLIEEYNNLKKQISQSSPNDPWFEELTQKAENAYKNLENEVLASNSVLDAAIGKQEQGIATLEEKLKEYKKTMAEAIVLGDAEKESSAKAKIEETVNKIKEAKEETENLKAKQTQYTQAIDGTNAALKGQVAALERSGSATDELYKKLHNQNSELQEMRNASMGLQRDFGQIVQMAGAGFIFGSAMNWAGSIKNTRSQFQQLEISFGTLLQSEEKANSLMDQLLVTAEKTPFSLEQLASGAQQLLAYGTSATKVNDTLVKLGDLAAGLGRSVNDIVDLYGTTVTKDHMDTLDLKQFKGRGIPIDEAIAEVMGKSVQEIPELITKGKVKGNIVEEAVAKLTSGDGKFAGMMANQSKTINGQISNIGDSVDMMMNEIGKKAEPLISGTLTAVGTLVEKWKAVGVAVGGAIVSYKAFQGAQKISNALAQKSAEIVEQGFAKERQELEKKMMAQKAGKMSASPFDTDLDAALNKGQINLEEAKATQKLRDEWKAYTKEVKDNTEAKRENRNEGAATGVELPAATPVHTTPKDSGAKKQDAASRASSSALRDNSKALSENTDEAKDNAKEVGSSAKAKEEAAKANKADTESIAENSNAIAENVESLAAESKVQNEVGEKKTAIAEMEKQAIADKAEGLATTIELEHEKSQAVDNEVESESVLADAIESAKEAAEGAVEAEEATVAANAESASATEAKAAAKEVSSVASAEEAATSEASAAATALDTVAEGENAVASEANAVASGQAAAAKGAKAAAEGADVAALATETGAEVANTGAVVANTNAEKANLTIRGMQTAVSARVAAAQAAVTATTATATGVTGFFSVAVKQATLAFWQFTAALMANPLMAIISVIGVAISAITGLVFWFNEEESAEEKATQALQEKQNKLVEMTSILGSASKESQVYKEALNDLIKACKDYGVVVDENILRGDDEIAKKKELARVSEELAEAYLREAEASYQAEQIKAATEEMNATKKSVEDKILAELKYAYKKAGGELDAEATHAAETLARATVEKVMAIPQDLNPHQYGQELDRVLKEAVQNTTFDKDIKDKFTNGIHKLNFNRYQMVTEGSRSTGTSTTGISETVKDYEVQKRNLSVLIASQKTYNEEKEKEIKIADIRKKLDSKDTNTRLQGYDEELKRLRELQEELEKSEKGGDSGSTKDETKALEENTAAKDKNNKAAADGVAAKNASTEATKNSTNAKNADTEAQNSNSDAKDKSKDSTDAHTSSINDNTTAVDGNAAAAADGANSNDALKASQDGVATAAWSATQGLDSAANSNFNLGISAQDATGKNYALFGSLKDLNKSWSITLTENGFNKLQSKLNNIWDFFKGLGIIEGEAPKLVEGKDSGSKKQTSQDVKKQIAQTEKQQKEEWEKQSKERKKQMDASIKAFNSKGLKTDQDYADQIANLKTYQTRLSGDSKADMELYAAAQKEIDRLNKSTTSSKYAAAHKKGGSKGKKGSKSGKDSAERIAEQKRAFTAEQEEQDWASQKEAMKLQREAEDREYNERKKRLGLLDDEVEREQKLLELEQERSLVEIKRKQDDAYYSIMDEARAEWKQREQMEKKYQELYKNNKKYVIKAFDEDSIDQKFWDRLDEMWEYLDRDYEIQVGLNDKELKKKLHDLMEAQYREEIDYLQKYGNDKEKFEALDMERTIALSDPNLTEWGRKSVEKDFESRLKTLVKESFEKTSGLADMLGNISAYNEEALKRMSSSLQRLIDENDDWTADGIQRWNELRDAKQSIDEALAEKAPTEFFKSASQELDAAIEKTKEAKEAYDRMMSRTVKVEVEMEINQMDESQLSDAIGLAQRKLQNLEKGKFLTKEMKDSEVVNQEKEKLRIQLQQLETIRAMRQLQTEIDDVYGTGYGQVDLANPQAVKKAVDDIYKEVVSRAGITLTLDTEENDRNIAQAIEGFTDDLGEVHDSVLTDTEKRILSVLQMALNTNAHATGTTTAEGNKTVGEAMAEANALGGEEGQRLMANLMALDYYDKAAGKITTVKEATEGYTNAQKKQSDAEKGMKNAREGLLSQWGKLSTVLGKAVGVIGQVGEALQDMGKKKVGIVISGIADLGQTVLDGIDSISDVVASSTEGMKVAAGAAVAAMSAAEKASFILTIISAAFQVAMKIFNLAKDMHNQGLEDDIKNLDRGIAKLQDAYTDLEYAVNKAFGKEQSDLINKQARNIEAQNALIRKQIEDEKKLKEDEDERKDKIEEYNNQIRDNERQLRDLREAAKDAIWGNDIQSAIEQFAEAYINAISDGTSFTRSAKELAVNMLKTMITTAMKSDLTTYMNVLRDRMNEFMSDGIVTADEQANIENAFAQQAEELHDKWAWSDNILKNKTLTEGASSGGFEAMNQDSADELNGRFAALQMSGVSINEGITLLNVTATDILENMTSPNGSFGQLLQIQADSFMELQAIQVNTFNTANFINGLRNEMFMVNQQLKRL